LCQVAREGPGDQTFLVSGTKIVENFDPLAAGQDFPVTNPYPSAIGQQVRTGDGASAGTFISTADPFGGVGHFGFCWSAGDGNNELVITMKDGTMETFVTQSIRDSPALQGSPADILTGQDGHYVKPNYQQPGVDAVVNTGSKRIEAYAFVNTYQADRPGFVADLLDLTAQSGLRFQCLLAHDLDYLP
jgi:hypothetical protein